MAPYPEDGYWLHELFYIQFALLLVALLSAWMGLALLINREILTINRRHLDYRMWPFAKPGATKNLRADVISKFYIHARPYMGGQVYTMVAITNSGASKEVCEHHKLEFTTAMVELVNREISAMKPKKA
jgi:hypothetical protein